MDSQTYEQTIKKSKNHLILTRSAKKTRFQNSSDDFHISPTVRAILNVDFNARFNKRAQLIRKEAEECNASSYTLMVYFSVRQKAKATKHCMKSNDDTTIRVAPSR